MGIACGIKAKALAVTHRRCFMEISTRQYTCRRVPLAQRNAPQVGIFRARNRLFSRKSLSPPVSEVLIAVSEISQFFLCIASI
jgi:hypothetical protein